MARTRRYAEGTAVSVERSRGEVTGILAQHGVVSMMWGTEPGGDVLAFELGGANYRLSVKRPTVETEQAWERKQGGAGNFGYIDFESRVEKEWKRRWRALVLILKAKLEFAEGDETTTSAARELMPYLVTASGHTLGELVETGRLPLALPEKRSH